MTHYLQVVEDGKCAEHQCALILVCPECTGVFKPDERIRALESEVASLRERLSARDEDYCGGCPDAEFDRLKRVEAAAKAATDKVRDELQKAGKWHVGCDCFARFAVIAEALDALRAAIEGSKG